MPISGGLVTMDRSRGIDSEWSGLRMRRLGLFIVGSIARGTRWAAFADDDVQCWDDLHGQISQFMKELRDADALSARVDRDPWYVIKDQPRDADGQHDCMKGAYLGPAFEDEEIEAFLSARGYPAAANIIQQ